jgi:hypothetical protein
VLYLDFLVRVERSLVLLGYEEKGLNDEVENIAEVADTIIGRIPIFAVRKSEVRWDLEVESIVRARIIANYYPNLIINPIVF